MGRPVVYNFAPSSVNAIILAASHAAGNIQFNGVLATGSNPSSLVSFPGVSRTVSLTSADDLHLVNVTITGTYRGAVVTETRVGPNANTVYTTQLFDTVTAVSVSAPVTTFSVGTGTTGRTHWFLSSYHTTGSTMSVQAVVTGTISYTFLATLDDVQTNSAPTTFTPATPVFVGTTTMSAATTSSLATYLAPTRYCCININSSNVGGGLVVTMVQQGIN